MKTWVSKNSELTQIWDSELTQLLVELVEYHANPQKTNKE